MKKTKLQKLTAIEKNLENRITKINNESFRIQSILLENGAFFKAVEQALNDGWAGSLQETSNFTDLLEEARNGDAEACGMLKNVFKPNPAFKKETARFANV